MLITLQVWNVINDKITLQKIIPWLSLGPRPNPSLIYASARIKKRYLKMNFELALNFLEGNYVIDYIPYRNRLARAHARYILLHAVKCMGIASSPGRGEKRFSPRPGLEANAGNTLLCGIVG